MRKLDKKNRKENRKENIKENRKPGLFYFRSYFILIVRI